MNDPDRCITITVSTPMRVLQVLTDHLAGRNRSAFIIEAIEEKIALETVKGHNNGG